MFEMGFRGLTMKSRNGRVRNRKFLLVECRAQMPKSHLVATGAVAVHVANTEFGGVYCNLCWC